MIARDDNSNVSSSPLAKYDSLLTEKELSPTFALLKEHSQERIPLHHETVSHPTSFFFEDVRLEALQCFDKNLKALHRQLRFALGGEADKIDEVNRAFVYYHQVIYQAIIKFCEKEDIDLEENDKLISHEFKASERRRKTRGEAHKAEDIPGFKGFFLACF